MKTTLIKVTLAAAAVCVAGITQAVPISGNIGFTGEANLNTSSVGTATEVVSWSDTVINGGSGTFASVPMNTPVTFATPWTFNSGAIADFWTAAGYTFNLTSSIIAIQTADFLAVSGVGTVSGNGFTASTIDWSFTSQNPVASQPVTFTFSASSSNVPDGGATVALLGGSLVTLAFIRRKVGVA